MTMGPVECLVVAFPGGNVGRQEGNRDPRRRLPRQGHTSSDVTAPEFDELGNLAGFVEIDAEAGT